MTSRPNPAAIADPFDRANALLVTASNELEDPLERVWAASRAAQAVHELTAEAVRIARAKGATWTEIGDTLGTTRQAAQQRFGSQ
jgi:hypothetical protein